MDFNFKEEIGEKLYLLTCNLLKLKFVQFEIELQTVEPVLICRKLDKVKTSELDLFED